MTEIPVPPFPESYWVVPGRLLAGPYPGHWQPEQAAPRLGALVACGIRHVINLMEANEVNSQGQPFVPYLEDMRALVSASDSSIGWTRYPIRDGSAPERAVMRCILDEIDTALAAGQPVYVHCWGGKGRTGTVIGCYLARQGLATGVQALEQIRELRKSILPLRLSPETEAQCQMVVSWTVGE